MLPLAKFTGKILKYTTIASRVTIEVLADYYVHVLYVKLTLGEYDITHTMSSIVCEITRQANKT